MLNKSMCVWVIPTVCICMASRCSSANDLYENPSCLVQERPRLGKSIISWFLSLMPKVFNLNQFSLCFRSKTVGYKAGISTTTISLGS